jgi:hypothetical protein
MVLEANKQYHAINKYIIAFINNATCLSVDQKEQLVSEWKTSSGAKLKTQMHKSVTKTPKRVVSKYLFFCEDERPKILQENPGIGIRDCTCLLGKRWAEFQQNPDPARMAVYEEKFATDKKRYDNEKRACEGDVPFIPEKAKKTHKSAYLNYCTERRKIEPKITMKDLSIGWAKVKEDPEKLALYAP